MRIAKAPFSVDNLSGLMWTEDLPGEIKLRFQIPPSGCELGLSYFKTTGYTYQGKQPDTNHFRRKKKNENDIANTN